MICVRGESEVLDAVRDARAHRRTLEIMGAGTKRAFGRVTQCDDVLDLSGLSGIVKYEPQELILTCLPGTPVVDINVLLATYNQRLGFEPADWGPLLGAPAGKATIGGVLSADANGSAAIRYGRARDSLLGFRAVNGFAEAYKGGGKVVKNVTGFDLPKLMCGAMGTLGVLTEVTLRVYPMPSHNMTLSASGVSLEGGFALLRRIWASSLEATGLGFVHGTAFVRLEGTQEVLNEKAAAARQLVPQLQEHRDEAVFANIANGTIFCGGNADVWRVQIAPIDAQALIEVVQPVQWQADSAGGLLWIGLPAGSDGTTLRKHGSAVLVRASEETRALAPPFAVEHVARAELTRSVKAAFDPFGIFNPARMWDGV